MIILRPGNLREVLRRRRQAGFIVNSNFDQGLLGRQTAAPVSPPTDDPNLWGWWSADHSLTNNGTLFTGGTWADRSGLGHDFLAPNAGTEPAYSSNGCNGRPCLSFQGTGYCRTATATLNQPFSVYLLVQIATFQNTKVIFDGLAGSPYSMLQMNTVSAVNKLQLYAGSYACDNVDFSYGTTWQVISFQFNGASSLIAVNSNTDTTGSPGTHAAGGVILGEFSAGGPYVATYKLGALIISAAANGSTIRTLHKTWLNSYAGI